MSHVLPRILAGMVCVLVAGYFLVSSRSKPNAVGSPSGSASPSLSTPTPGARPGGDRDERIEAAKSVVYAMEKAAENGNVQAYVRCFAGAKGQEIAALVRERGEKAFAEALRKTNREIKGLVLHSAQNISPNQVRMKCEVLFIDHNEMQELTLEEGRSGWRIVGLAPLGSFQMARPYGSLVYPVIEETAGGEETSPATAPASARTEPPGPGQ